MKMNKREVILAFDRESVRKYDTDGRMYVKRSHISKAGVNPYWGKEIPEWEGLGLDPDRVYNVFRPPEELRKGAETFKTLPILLIHKHVTADNPQKDLIIGATGSNVEFDGEYLDNDLGFWDSQYIDKIESDEQRELSSSYRYVAILENGSYDGSPYDIKMTNIEGNHVALVVEGRAGPDVLVADTQIHSPEKVRTVKLNPKQLAALKKRMPQLKVAMDEGLDTGAAEQALEEALEEVQSLGDDPGAADGNEEVTALLKKVLEMLEGKGAGDEDAEAKKAAADEAARRAEEARKADEAKNAGAMDAKIEAAKKDVRESIEGRFRAAEKVAPITGKLDAMAFDSADKIYAHALKVGGIKPEDHPAAAYAGMVDVLVANRAQSTPVGAADSADTDELFKQFPALAKINHA
ncbi:DUF2213 domain-containing protein [Pandoraea sp.]|uniref:DUF2213 domain-containing protein n=1 Tax=Pandoraea sp. TaxID=1883445 RepID=UPI0025EAF654|nr:DUF2213 domain-containing protein [Pandoraea sp.]